MIKQLAVAAGALGLAVSGVTSAQAQPVRPHTTTITVPMHLVGYDPAVAKAHGYVIKKDSQGREYSVKAGANLRTVKPNNTIPGDCGSSTLTFVATGGHNASMATSFVLAGVDGYAVDYNWVVQFSDHYGTSQQHWGGGLATRRSWATTFTFHSGGTGPAYAQVIPGSSYAILVDGGVCHSGGPSDMDTIY